METRIYMADGSVINDFTKVRSYEDVLYVEVIQTMTIHDFIQRYIV